MAPYSFEVLHFKKQNQDPESFAFNSDEYRKAGEKFTLLRIQDFQIGRKGNRWSGYYPYTTLTIRRFNEDGKEIDKEQLASNLLEEQQFDVSEPMIEALFEAHEEGEKMVCGT